MTTTPTVVYHISKLSFCIEKKECIPVGCVPTARWPYSGVCCFQGGVYLVLGGVYLVLGGVLSPGGMSGPGGHVWSRGCVSGPGVCVWSRGGACLLVRYSLP